MYVSILEAFLALMRYMKAKCKKYKICAYVLQVEEVLTCLLTKTAKLTRGQMAFSASVHVICLLASHHLLKVAGFLLDQPLPWSE